MIFVSRRGLSAIVISGFLGTNTVAPFFPFSTEAKFLGTIQTKVLRVFLLAIHSHLYSFAVRFMFLQIQATFYVVFQTHATSYRFIQFTFYVQVS
jgi:hypothetical protein